MKRIHKFQRRRGAVIAETGAALALFLPLAVLITFVGVEVSYAYLLKSSLSEGAREAARSLAIAYGVGTNVDPGTAGEAKVFSNIRIHNVINDNQQFEAQWKKDADPPTVTVTVKYASDKYGLPHFPNPDPLRLGDNFIVYGAATFRLH
jgi:Flp pilus assembly protein TadG